MNSPADDSLLTRRTLLSRLRNLDDQERWRTFFNLYWRLLYNVARKSGLDDPGAQEIVRDTVIAVARRMPEFRYDQVDCRQFLAVKSDSNAPLFCGFTCTAQAGTMGRAGTQLAPIRTPADRGRCGRSATIPPP